MFFDDQLVRAIRNYIAPDVMTALQQATGLQLACPMETVRVPLQAGVTVAYNKGLAAFSVDATIRDADVHKWLGGRSYFSTTEFMAASDKAKMIEYLFDLAKKQMLDALAQGEFDRLLRGKHPLSPKAGKHE